jgi:hypothetical protein
MWSIKDRKVLLVTYLVLGVLLFGCSIILIISIYFGENLFLLFIGFGYLIFSIHPLLKAMSHFKALKKTDK